MLGIIGGSGLYDLDGVEIKERHHVDTPFGSPSCDIMQGEYEGADILFLARHGAVHNYLPHEVNYAANIFALKKLGASKVLGVSAVGSLRYEIKPADLVLPDQYFDHTKGTRKSTFFGNGIAAHISSANPVCPMLSQDVIDAAKRIGQPLHTNKTYACVEGARLGTRAESFFLRDAAKCDIVGMTNVPEVFLAREAQMAYATICVVTDYDCWMDDPDQHVSVEKFREIYARALEGAKSVIAEMLKKPLSDTPREISHALKTSVLTPDENFSSAQKEWMKVLRA